MILASTVHSYEDMSPRKMHAVWESNKKILWVLREPVSDEEAVLSVSTKFTVFPFQVLFLNQLQNYCHQCQLSVCFGGAQQHSKVCLRKMGKASARRTKHNSSKPQGSLRPYFKEARG